MSLSKKIKIGLDETRILILGSQILLGFGFQVAFRQGFQNPTKLDASFAVAGVSLITLTVGLIISPSAQHRLVEEGRDTFRLLGVIRRYAAFALAPFAVALAIDVFLAAERVAGRLAGFAGAALGAAAGFFWYGYAYWKRSRGPHRQSGEPKGSAETAESTSLAKKIEQMLTETRVVLPGAQALLGFQLIIVFSEPFEKLAAAARGVHLAALGCVALAAIWLMTPAACHRIAFDGEDSEGFHRLGTRFLLAATGALALGIAADLGVVVDKLLNSAAAGMAAGGLSATVLLGLWLVYPLVLRSRKTR